MSKQWTAIRDSAGKRRLHQPDDLVRLEIASSFQRGVPILPILVGGAAMPKPRELPDKIRKLAGINAHEMSDTRWNEDFETLIRLIDQARPTSALVTELVNPFISRAAIREDSAFHGRDNERRMLRDYLLGGQNCQVVGPRQIGKSSILRFIKRHHLDWCPQARLAYLDLQDPRCHTLVGWLREIALGMKLETVPRTLTEFSEAIDALLDAGLRPCLCLDEFGQMTARAPEFTADVFLTLRSCGQRGLSILTAAPKRLSELTDPHNDSSPFFNTFPVLSLKPFSASEARAFVERDRPSVPAFTETEKQRILEFAEGHPLALQTACYHILAARNSREPLPVALGRAREDCGRIIG